MGDIAGLLISMFCSLSSNPKICDTPECLKTNDMILKNLYPDAPKQYACRNFHEYTCKGFIDAHSHSVGAMPGYLYSAQDEQRKEVNARIADLLLMKSDDKELQVVQKVRQAYMNCHSQSSDCYDITKCVTEMKERYPRVITYLLVKKYNGEKKRKEVSKIVRLLKTAFETVIKENKWLHESVKKEMKRKINDLEVNIAHWDDIIDEDKLELPLPFSFIHPLSGSVAYLYNCHALYVPMAVIFFPKYDLGLESLIIAALGFEIAQTMGFVFDSLCTYPLPSNPPLKQPIPHIRICIAERSFNSPSQEFNRMIKKQYREKAQCLVDQMGQMGLQSDDERHLTQCVQSGIGFQLAFQVYHQYYQSREINKRLPDFKDFSMDQIFTLMFANLMCETIPNRALINDGYAPAEVRVNTAVMNSPDFGGIWNCESGTDMNPLNKCEIW